MTGWKSRAPILVILLVTALVYWPGLKGPFLFDDFSNLALLAEAGRLDRPENVIHYLLSGFAGPTGRPVAMASFIPQAGYWPDDPFPFKGVNLLLHLVNALLLARVIERVLTARHQPPATASATAVLAAGIWALHPLWVSTTLYVVQRMTLLAATFTLLGLLLYLSGRAAIVAGRARQGWWRVIMGVYGMGLLAVLSKENGALLPLLVLVVERYGLAGTPVASLRERRRLGLVVGLPALAVVSYLASALPTLFVGDAGIRPFTPWQRLLTEGRVLWHYLAQLVSPQLEPGGLYAQEIPLSHGLFSPWTTAAAWAGLAAAWMLAERWRANRPSLALAITFFLAGHLLESTWLPLELAFEHRNYLPAMFLFLPIAEAIVGWNTIPRRVTVVILLALLASLTALRADLWGRPFAQALAWAERNPDSARAQVHLATLWLETGHIGEAARILDQTLERHPKDLLAAANRLFVACAAGHPSRREVDVVLAALAAAPIAHTVTQYQITRVLAPLREGRCGPAGREVFDALWRAAWTAAREQPAYRANLLQERALLHLADGHIEAADADLRQALALAPGPDAQLAAAALLASHGAFDAALALLDQPLPPRRQAGPGIVRVREWWLERIGYWERERRHLRATIQTDRAGALPRPVESANVATP